MMIEERIPLIDEVLGERKNELGHDYRGYRNHVYRTVHFCFALDRFNDEEREKILIAACFHDLGIWTDDTFDYLLPSAELAAEYLNRNGLGKWVPDIELMIGQHHRLRPYRGESRPLIETFRKADLADFSLGAFRSGIPRSYIRAVKGQFPNAGFHRRLVRLAGGWICRHPLNPLPVVKL